MKKYIFFSGFIFLIALFSANSWADNTDASPWTLNEIVIEEVAESPDAASTFYGGNIDCTDRKVITEKELKVFGVQVPFLDEHSHDACSIKTKFGFWSNTGYLTRNGTDLGGQIYFANNHRNTVKDLTPIPNSDKVLMKTQQGIKIINNFDSHLTSEYKDTTVKHYLDLASAGYLTDSQGNKINVELYPLGFSANGRWLVSESSAGGIVRYDLYSNEYRVFTRNFNHNNGLNPQALYTVSGDGRYVMVASAPQQKLTLFDLENCRPPLPGNKFLDCDQVDLLQKLRNKYFDFLGSSHIRFMEENVLKLNIKYKNQEGAAKTSEALIYPDGFEPDKATGYGYLALGDSFASGEGAYEYRPGTDQKDPFNKCHLSQRSYPFLAGSELGLDQYESVACSGAVIGNIGSTDEENNINGEPPQARGFDTEADFEYITSNFLPGYLPQLEFVKNYKPSIITLSISGNDVGFGDIVKTCVVFGSNCYKSYEDRYNKILEINDQYQRLLDTYGAAKQLTAPKAKIYAIGYPSLVKESGYCELNVRLSQDEIIFANQLVKYLNLVIEKAAINSGIYYVDVEEAFGGHKLCDAVLPSEVAVNGLTAGDEKFFDLGPIGNESYHPNAIGHRLLKDAIIDKTSGFEAKPTGQTVEPPKPSDADFLLEGVPYEGGQIFSGFGTISVEETILDFHTKVISEGYAPGSSVYLELHSNPVDLGEYTADESGNIDAGIDLPQDTPSGFHTLYAYGENILGEKIRSQKLVYVASSADDLDGDGTPNENDACLVFKSSGVDTDNDGVDDACDGFIGQEPSEELLDDVVGETDIIEEMDQTNTNTQAGQDLQNLQPQGNQTQQTGSNFQNSSGVNLSDSNTNDLLNKGLDAGSLSVGVAGANSQTSIAPPQQPVATQDSGVSPLYVIIILFLFFLSVFLIYRRARKFDREAMTTSPAEEELLEGITWVTKEKKKRKKPKKAHHR